MSSRQPITTFETHEVINQPLPLPPHNLFDGDLILRQAVEREGAASALEKLRKFGAVLGSEQVVELGRAANRFPPELRTFDRFGQRIDQVDYHPAYHELMKLAKVHEVHSIAWNAAQPGGHVAHMALEYLLVQADAGVC